ncbi:cellulase family glycosylhydrolase [Carboxylicivirga sp. N1Y90]|uniref:cellulase family glycosylhydrolase n=1 Tax=Carboxylicivirga fragile TaxID=3417571 RepID=UPI003D339397|nr:cellulase family glycosylhydrolase [Marinilabiliaceae bacterium N1Y90]
MKYSNSKIYHLVVIILISSISSCQSKHGKQIYTGFKTEASQLLDANGNPFIMRGINVPNAWHPKQSYQALETIADQKVNCVRLVWESHLSADGLDSVLQKCIDLEMIPMVELHDATGDSTAAKLYQMAAYFTSDEMKSIIHKYEKYLIINIANEWGSNGLSAEYWRDAYKKCLVKLRQSGYRNTIVIDGPGWGQNIQPILLYGNDLIEFDPLHNLLFSVHMYGSWNDEEKIKNDLMEARNKSIPLIVGEFGYNYNKGDNNLNCSVNHKQILKTCADLNMGYLVWSWTGNNEENNWLDLVVFEDWKTLTYWGEEIFNSPVGISETAKKATIFNKK